MKLPSFLSSESFSLGNFSLPVNYLQAAAIVGLLFILVLLLAKFRRHYIDWSIKGGIVGIFFGFLLALILEGFLVIGGRTALTEVMGWKNAPKPIQVALDGGRNKLIQVLGVEDEIPSSYAKGDTTVNEAIETLQSLNPDEVKKVKALFCAP